MLAWGAALAVTMLFAAAVVALLWRAVSRGRERERNHSTAWEATARRLRSVVDAVAEPMLIVEADGRVALANRAAAGLFGGDAAELESCHVERLLPAFRMAEEGGPAAAREAARTQDGGTAARAYRRDGTGFSVQVDSAAIGPDGARILVVRDLAAARRSAVLVQASAGDSPTAPPDQTQLTEQLRSRVEAASARRQPFSLFVLDLDGLAEVNRDHGHAVGDRLLAEVAERLRRSLRTTDVVARLGGDDFAVIPGGATPATAGRIARQILAAFKEPFVIDGHTVEASASIGVANFPDHGTDAETLMGRAEIARLAAKSARRGWVVYTADEDVTEVEARAVRLTELRRALDDQELELFYRPVVRVVDAALVGLEATVRWRHRRLGLLSPDQFVRAAEQTEIIRPLTRAILGMAIEQQARWREMGYALRVGVRIAGRNAQDRQLPRAVASLLERWSVPASALCIAVDENTRLPATSQVLRALTDAGVGLALDNHGSGSASLLRLRGLPLGELRLDPVLVASVRSGDAGSAAVREVVDMAHALGLSVTARGVDDEATLAGLRRLGCDSAQGRLWGEPVPAAAVIPLLRLLARQSRFPGLGRYRPGEPDAAGGAGASSSSPLAGPA